MTSLFLFSFPRSSAVSHIPISPPRFLQGPPRRTGRRLRSPIPHTCNREKPWSHSSSKQSGSKPSSKEENEVRASQAKGRVYARCVQRWSEQLGRYLPGREERYLDGYQVEEVLGGLMEREEFPMFIHVVFFLFLFRIRRGCFGLVLQFTLLQRT